MNRYAFILLAVLVLGGIAAFELWPHSSSAPGSPSQLPNDNVLSQNSYGIQSATGPQQDVLAAYKKALTASGDPDNIKPGQTFVVGQYALQLWVGEHTGGQALLKYDLTQGEWSIVDPGGGEWSAEGLEAFGVPTSTAQALVTQASQ